MEEQFNTMKFYREKVVKTIFFIGVGATIAAILACVMCIVNHQFASTPRPLFVAFIIIGIIEVISLIGISRSVFKDKEIEEREYNILKYAVCIICMINYAFLINLMPSQAIWSSFMFFLMIIAVFQDFKLTIKASVIYGIITIVFLATHSIESLQQTTVQDEMMVRIQIVGLGILGALINSYFSGHILAGVGQDLMNKNTQQLTNVIGKVSNLMNQLRQTTETLVGISQEENASMEEIASVSESIVGDNNIMIHKSEDSQNNLNILSQGIHHISQEMEITKTISNDLLDMSTRNEEALNNVLEIGNAINESTNHTLSVTQTLQRKADEIDGLLKLIENIAEETNLLALNASIEAARAGEEGRGFAVVAEQVKKLSENTSASLKDVNRVIEEFKADTRQVEQLMEGNVEQIQRQSVVTQETVETITKMLTHLKDSADKIVTMEDLTKGQNAYTKEAVVFNEQVIENMKEQMDRVETISELVEENKQAIESIVAEVDTVNGIVEEISMVLEN
ncbi:MAG: hypothetical protein E7231_08120 [Cellulosilyticum sp.]|nr:hypothetical protein [Cellulosilyticum sp.]